MNKRAIGIAFLLVASSLLVSCQSHTRTSTLLADNLCKPPCWKAITPGQSTRQEVLAQLASLPEVKVDSITENHVNEHQNNVWSDFTQEVAEVGVRVYFDDQIALATEFDARDAITVAQVIEKTGEPEWSFAKSGCADTRWLSIGLLNRTRGIYIEYFDSFLQRDEKAEISPDNPVFSVTYFEPSLYDKVLNSYIILDATDDPITFSKSLKPWSGYGEVAYLDICR